MVTVAADEHLHCATQAVIQPIRLLFCPHASRTQHWTKLRIAGIKATRTRLCACERVEGPGFCQEFTRAFVYPASGNSIARKRRIDVCGASACLASRPQPRPTTAFGSIRPYRQTRPDQPQNQNSHGKRWRTILGTSRANLQSTARPQPCLQTYSYSKSTRSNRFPTYPLRILLWNG